MGAIRKPINWVLARVSARGRIAVGQVFLLASVLWLAMAIGMVPNERAATMDGRAKLCEAIAVHASVFVERGEPEALAATLRAVVERNEEMLSAAVRDDAGGLLVEVGEHANNWNKLSGEAAIDSYLFVPVYANEHRWGTIEMRFRPMGGSGWLGYVNTPQTQLLAFVASACLGLYLLYLRKMLQHLDPSKVVPSRVRSALDTLAEGLLVMDNEQRIVLANQAFATLVGKSPAQLLGTRADVLRWTRQRDPNANADESGEYPWAAAIRDGVARSGVSLRLTDAAGTPRAFAVNCSPVMGHNGKYSGVLASFDDVTRLEQKEAELRKSKEAAESANRAKSEFLAHMSHEIRTPMNAVLGFTDVLRRGYEAGEAERRDYLNTIHASGQHLLELINDILDLSKIESGRLEVERVACSPHEAIGGVASVLRGKAIAKGIELEYAWDGPLPLTIQSDPTRLRQVLTNLAGNAIKFTETGRVRIVARLLRGATDAADARLAVDVIDSGIGMSPEGLARIFQPFAQADSSITRKFGGTGLGLAISKQLAEALGGGIAVASEQRKGSTFTVTINVGPLTGVPILPAMPAPETASAATGSENAARLPPARVLVVEDGASNQKLIALVLRRAGLTVELASDGKAGFDLAIANPYDVVLMDMQMPVMDGYSATRALRAQGYAVPIIALTAHAMKGEEEKCLAAGCSGFLTKPIDIDLLLNTLRGILTANGARAGTAEAAATPHPAEPASAVSAAAAGIIASPSLVPTPAMVATPATVEPPASRVVVAAPTPASGEPILSTLPTDDADFREIVVEFVDRLHQQLGAIGAAYEQRSMGELASLAHWLKGSGGTAGFAAFTKPAAALERSARDANLEDVQRTIAELTALAQRIEVPTGPGVAA